MSSTLPAAASSAVLQASSFSAEGQTQVKGVDYSQPVTLDALAEKMLTTGFQATNVGHAIKEVNRMLNWAPPPPPEVAPANGNPPPPADAKCTIFLAYTSNLISSGLRETFLHLVKNRLVDVIVTTAGGVEEDFIKCLAPTFLGDFKLKGSDLRAKGINRLGNLLVPNANYCAFEDWVSPILHKMTDEQVASGTKWTPSSVISRLGKEIDNEESVYYWAHKHGIPVFCPAITDGSLGDMMYFHSYRRPEFVVDVVADIRKINDIAVHAHCTGMVILGGGVVKHHTCNANLMRNGADFSVYINTAQEFDGSDAGASPDEAISWGKIKLTANPVKVYCDATLIFPLLVTQTFLKPNRRQRLLEEQAEKEANRSSSSTK